MGFSNKQYNLAALDRAKGDLNAALEGNLGTWPPCLLLVGLVLFFVFFGCVGSWFCIGGGLYA